VNRLRLAAEEHDINNPDIREAFAQARASGLRAREAAEAIGLSEGAALAAHTEAHNARLQCQPLRPDWLRLLKSLEDCGPLMALTRNDSVVHEKTGVYQTLSQHGHVGMALGHEIDLRLFFNHWHAGFAMAEPASDAAKTSLQFFNRHGTAVHKIFPREQTDLVHWARCVAAATDPSQAVVFEPVAPKKAQPAAPREGVDAVAFEQAWSAMTDTHCFFGLLKRFGLQRQSAFRLVKGRYSRQLPTTALRELLLESAFDGLPIMCFVGSPGCIQIHTGPVKRVEPMAMQGKQWLNVLDPGFNLHLLEDLVAEVWVVEKPTADGMVTSVEAFDADGELMAMFFGARKPGQPELLRWREIVAGLRHSAVATA
jgi:putative hemin transport protein